ncbi:MAG: site-2 protease family protein [Thermodesulfobacteriota bacterium]
MDFLVTGVLWYFVFLFSLVLHEAAHSLAAFKLGDRTAYLSGQVSLSPVPHVRREPFGTVVVPVISYLVGGWMMGWASAPYDPFWARNYPKRSALMALAGPGANLLLVLTAGALIRMGLALEVFGLPPSFGLSSITAAPQGGIAAFFAAILSITFTLNLILFLFNLLPIPGFDGSHALTLFLSDEQARRFMDLGRNPILTVVGLVVAWNMFHLLFIPVLRFALRLLY